MLPINIGSNIVLNNNEYKIYFYSGFFFNVKKNNFFKIIVL